MALTPRWAWAATVAALLLALLACSLHTVQASASPSPAARLSQLAEEWEALAFVETDMETETEMDTEMEADLEAGMEAELEDALDDAAMLENAPAPAAAAKPAAPAPAAVAAKPAAQAVPKPAAKAAAKPAAKAVAKKAAAKPSIRARAQKYVDDVAKRAAELDGFAKYKVTAQQTIKEKQQEAQLAKLAQKKAEAVAAKKTAEQKTLAANAAAAAAASQPAPVAGTPVVNSVTPESAAAAAAATAAKLASTSSSSVLAGVSVEAKIEQLKQQWAKEDAERAMARKRKIEEEDRSELRAEMERVKKQRAAAKAKAGKGKKRSRSLSAAADAARKKGQRVVAPAQNIDWNKKFPSPSLDEAKRMEAAEKQAEHDRVYAKEGEGGCVGCKKKSQRQKWPVELDPTSVSQIDLPLVQELHRRVDYLLDGANTLSIKQSDIESAGKLALESSDLHQRVYDFQEKHKREKLIPEYMKEERQIVQLE